MIDDATGSRSDRGYFGLSKANASPLHSYFACVLIVDEAGKYIFAALDTIEYWNNKQNKKGRDPMKHNRHVSFAPEYEYADEYADMPYRGQQPKETMPSDKWWVREVEAIYEKNMFDAWLAVVRDVQERIANRRKSRSHARPLDNGGEKVGLS